MLPFFDKYAVWCEENVFFAPISILKSEQKCVMDECEEDRGRDIINVNVGRLE